jgi:AcrR family transcriptional regulator
VERAAPPGPGRAAPAPAPGRLGRAERREALLDAAAALVSSGSIEDVSMESVAERAGVSRPLVYKHFANRDELLGAVHRREAARLHDRLVADVAAAGDVEGMFRALVRGALRAAAERGHLFAALRSAGAWNREVAREQRARDNTTVRAFAARVARERGVERERAVTATAMLLSLVDPIPVRWRLDPTPEHAALLEETYMTIVTASLAALGGD